LCFLAAGYASVEGNPLKIVFCHLLCHLWH